MVLHPTKIQMLKPSARNNGIKHDIKKLNQWNYNYYTQEIDLVYIDVDKKNNLINQSGKNKNRRDNPIW